ncbi:hypothetical protein OFB79_24285, partial [Escherichia coli]|nr:hypothetical protein [Escherichia coli]
LQPSLYIIGIINRSVILLKKGSRKIIRKEIFLENLYIALRGKTIPFYFRISLYNNQRRSSALPNPSPDHYPQGALYISPQIYFIFILFLLRKPEDPSSTRIGSILDNRLIRIGTLEKKRWVRKRQKKEG